MPVSRLVPTVSPKDAPVGVDQLRSADVSPTERAFIEEMVEKARRGIPLTGNEKAQLRRVIIRHWPKAENWEWRKIVKIAVALAG